MVSRKDTIKRIQKRSFCKRLHDCFPSGNHAWKKKEAHDHALCACMHAFSLRMPLDDHACFCFYAEGIPNKRRRLPPVSFHGFFLRVCL